MDTLFAQSLAAGVGNSEGVGVRQEGPGDVRFAVTSGDEPILEDGWEATEVQYVEFDLGYEVAVWLVESTADLDGQEAEALAEIGFAAAQIEEPAVV